MSVIPPSELCLDVAKLFPPKGQWSEQEYLALDTNRLVELSDGSIEVLEMGNVQTAARPVRLWPGKFREPDVLFMLAEHRERRTEQYWNGADLVMEVVSEDRSHDLVKKRSEYARGGIAEYWIVDPMLKEITVLRLAGDQYEPAGVYHPGEQAASVLLAGFAVDVTAVFEAK
jgi:Uma2 family endonuclease